jgi:sulfite exporter TauE/SafE
MDAALAASALMMGLAGAPHCAAMCGAAFGGIARQGGAAGSAGNARALWALHVGRFASYTVAGALVAASVSALAGLGGAAPVLRPVWTLLHVGAVALGVALMWRGCAPAWLAGAGRHGSRLMQARPVRFFTRLPVTGRAAVVGSCWGAMPCGLLQSALIVAALASGPLQGAGVMAGFALTSALGLWLGPALWSRLRRAGGPLTHTTLPVRLAGALLVAASGFALVHGLRAAIDQALCLAGGS